MLDPPVTSNRVAGLEEPTPTLPLDVTLNRSVPFVDAVRTFAPVAERASVPAFVRLGVVTEVLADSVVNAPVLGDDAPTVPLMLIEAVPVRFVTVPLLGVPRAPPLTSRVEDAGIVVPFSVVVLLLDRLVKAPVFGDDAPTVVPLIEPPVIATLFASCTPIVPIPRFKRAVEADNTSDRLLAFASFSVSSSSIAACTVVATMPPAGTFVTCEAV